MRDFQNSLTYPLPLLYQLRNCIGLINPIDTPRGTLHIKASVKMRTMGQPVSGTDRGDLYVVHQLKTLRHRRISPISTRDRK